MSILVKTKNTQETSIKQESATTLAKGSRPTSAPYKNFSKPLAKDATPPARPKSVGAAELQARIKATKRPAKDSAPPANAKLVGPQELQARIKAARRSQSATRPLPESVHRNGDHSPALIHPALRARSGVTPNVSRSPKHKKSGGDLSMDAVIRRLQTDVDVQDPSKRTHQQVPGQSNSVSPVPAAFPPPPPVPQSSRPYQSLSRKSSMTIRKSPLSNVSSPDDSDETSSIISKRTSASSRTSKSRHSQDDEDDKEEMIRVISPRASMAKLIKRKSDPEPPVQEISQAPSQHSKISWVERSRRSILCSI